MGAPQRRRNAAQGTQGFALSLPLEGLAVLLAVLACSIFRLTPAHD